MGKKLLIQRDVIIEQPLNVKLKDCLYKKALI